MPPYTDLHTLEVAILARLEDLSKPSNYDFDTWLACNQILLQIRQTQLLQSVSETLSRQTQLLQSQTQLLQSVSGTLSEWNRRGVRVFP